MLMRSGPCISGCPEPGTLLYPQSIVIDLVDVAVDANAAAAARPADEQAPPINASFALALGHLRRPTPGSLPTMVPLSPWAGGWASVVSLRGRYTGLRGVRPGGTPAPGPPALFTMMPIVAIAGSGSSSSTGPYARTARRVEGNEGNGLSLLNLFPLSFSYYGPLSRSVRSVVSLRVQSVQETPLAGELGPAYLPSPIDDRAAGVDAFLVRHDSRRL